MRHNLDATRNNCAELAIDMTLRSRRYESMQRTRRNGNRYGFEVAIYSYGVNNHSVHRPLPVENIISARVVPSIHTTEGASLCLRDRRSLRHLRKGDPYFMPLLSRILTSHDLEVAT